MFNRNSKSRNRLFCKIYFYKSMHRLKILDYQHFSDPSPHRQQVGLSDSPEKRESDDPVSLTSFF